METYNENNVIDIPVEGGNNSQIVPVNNNGEVHEITKGEAIVGGLAGAGISILLWEGLKFVGRKVVLPLCRKVVTKFDNNTTDPLEQPASTAGNSNDPEKSSKVKIPGFNTRGKTAR